MNPEQIVEEGVASAIFNVIDCVAPIERGYKCAWGEDTCCATILARTVLAKAAEIEASLEPLQ